MRFGILGALAVDEGSVPVAVRGARRQALLLRLLVAANRPVPKGRLADDVWEGDPPPGAASTLTSHLSLLRRLLGADRITHGAGGYTLRVGPGELDAADFEDDVAAGNAALSRGEPRAAAAHFERGLGRWRGPALADVAGADWAQGTIARLDELRWAGEESLLESQLALGLHHQVVAAAQAAAEAQPLREQRWATLMLALYRSGRQADALRAFQRLRRTLDDQLGLEPSPSLRALEESIVLYRPELDWSDASTPSTAVPGVPVPGRETGPSASGDLPSPGALAQPTAEYVGRRRERAALGRAFDRAVSGDRQVVMVGGEPGIGKTALLSVLADSVTSRGGAVLYGRCLDLGAPYQPLLDALGHYVETAPPAELEAHVAVHGGELSRLVPALARRLPGVPPASSSDPETERHLAFSAAGGLVVEACRHRPVLLAVDDLHWADAATLALLRRLVTDTVGSALLVVGTFRSSEVPPGHALADSLAALWREPGVRRLELVGLTSDDVLDLCVAMAGHPVDDLAFVANLQRDTGGNPFFVRELLRHLAEDGALVRVDGTDDWVADRNRLRWGLPTSLREVINERVHHLGPDAPDVLSLASVIGVEFELPVLARAADSDEEALLDLVERAEAAALLAERDDGTFAFAHALTRHTLYDALGGTRRRRLHGRVAAALASGVAGIAPPALLAYHFTEAGELEAALPHAQRAGRAAAQAMAQAEAARWFGGACRLAATVDPDDRLLMCDLTMQLGVAQLLAGDPTHRQTLLEAGRTAEAVGDAHRMALAALANSRGYYSAAGQTDHERLGALRSALGRLEPDDDDLRVRLLGAECSESVFDTPLEERVAAAGRAVGEARALGDPFTLLSVLNLVCESLRHPSVLPLRLDHTAEALVLADAVGQDPAATFWAVTNRMQALTEAGAVSEAEPLFDRLVGIAEEVGHPAMRWMVVFTGAQWALLRGETARGEALAEEALAVGQALGQPDAFNYYATQISHARWQQGRLAELVELIEAGARDNPGIPAYRGALARALLQAGRFDEAGTLLEKGAASGFADLPRDLLWSYGLTAYAEVAVQLEHVGAATVLYGELAPYDGYFTFIGTVCEGPIAHYLGGLAGVIGRLDEADRHLDAADSLATSAGSPFYTARVLIERGRVAARRGDVTGARGLLTEGRELADRWGFSGEARRATAELAGLDRGIDHRSPEAGTRNS